MPVPIHTLALVLQLSGKTTGSWESLSGHHLRPLSLVEAWSDMRLAARLGSAAGSLPYLARRYWLTVPKIAVDAHILVENSDSLLVPSRWLTCTQDGAKLAMLLQGDVLGSLSSELPSYPGRFAYGQELITDQHTC